MSDFFTAEARTLNENGSRRQTAASCLTGKARRAAASDVCGRERGEIHESRFGPVCWRCYHDAVPPDEVVDPELRDLALQLVRRETAGIAQESRIEDRILLNPRVARYVA